MSIVIKQPGYPPPNGTPAYREPSVITDFIIHHEDGLLSETPIQVDAQHRAQGWDMIGYTWVIGEDGTIYQGRPVNMVPSAAYGRNTQSVDVSLTGDFQPGTPGYNGSPTLAQIKSLKELCLYAHQTIPTIERTIGHRDVATMFYPDDTGDYSTDCPGTTLWLLIPEIRAYVSANLK